MMPRQEGFPVLRPDGFTLRKQEGQHLEEPVRRISKVEPRLPAADTGKGTQDQDPGVGIIEGGDALMIQMLIGKLFGHVFMILLFPGKIRRVLAVSFIIEGMKVLLLPNAFKGIATSCEVSQLLTRLLKGQPELTLTAFPFSDGGDGTLASYPALYGKAVQRKTALVQGPDLGQKVKAPYLIYQKTAVIETAKICGLALSHHPNPMVTTTYGIGQLVQKILAQDVQTLILGLGGSSTNDGGSGMLAALGYQFLDKNNQPFIPTGGTLIKVVRIEKGPAFNPKLSSLKVILLSDVTNPLLGPRGATATFAPQKGAKPEDLPLLEEGMRHFSSLITQGIGRDETKTPGSGAAGGLGFAGLTLLNGTLLSGASYFLRQPRLQEAMAAADVIVTGEGHLDSQTLQGKGIDVLLATLAAHPEKKPRVLVLGGRVDNEVIDALHQKGADAVLEVGVDLSRIPKEKQKAVATRAFKKAIQAYLESDFSLFKGNKASPIC
jgi:glycerate kinase